MPSAEAKNPYYEAVGRRKTAVARIRVTEDKKPTFVVNEKPLDEYFQDPVDQQIAREALEKVQAENGTFSVSVKVSGSGVKAQAEAVRQGIARAMVEFNPEFRTTLKAFGYLTRDPRMRERKKFGLKRARRAPQWRKR